MERGVKDVEEWTSPRWTGIPSLPRQTVPQDRCHLPSLCQPLALSLPLSTYCFCFPRLIYYFCFPLSFIILVTPAVNLLLCHSFFQPIASATIIAAAATQEQHERDDDAAIGIKGDERWSSRRADPRLSWHSWQVERKHFERFAEELGQRLQDAAIVLGASANERAQNRK